MISYKKYILPEFLISLIKYSYLGWLIYFLVFNLYSIFWRQVNVQLGYDYISTLVWFLKEWGIWLIFTPAILLCLEKTVNKLPPISSIFSIGLVCLFITITVRILINSGEYPLGWVATTVLIFPKYISAYLVISMVWYFLRKQKSHKLASSKDLNDTDEQVITVEHHGLSKTLKCSQIFSIKSSGNYIEIEDENTTYLKRCTLKKFLGELPNANFIQVHRSYAINLDKITKLVNTDNGGSIATMSNCKNIPVSRRYKSSLKTTAIPSN